METIPERLETASEPTLTEPGTLEPAPAAPDELDEVDAALSQLAAGELAEPVPGPGLEPVSTSARRRWVAFSTPRELLFVLALYIATRCLLLLAAYLQASFGHHDFLHELANWDGLWYREVANHGYLNHPSDAQTTLGFFPLFPLTMFALRPLVLVLSNRDQIWAVTVAGVFISMVGGAVACHYIFRLAESWWDRETAMRATVLFILFPGSVVFSMVYSEGLLLPLAAACLLALQRKQWVKAGILAGFATAVQPVALALVPVCLVSAGLELRRSGWRPRVLRRVLWAPVLSTLGIVAFAGFLWLWTGTPLANYQAQHHGWSEKTDPLAIVNMVSRLAGEISLAHFNQPTINLNLVVGLIGTFLLLFMLVLVYLERSRIPVEALVWTGVVSFLALTSEYVPPNPRMLITAFPALMATARYSRGWRWPALLWTNTILLIGLSVLTFYGTTLRP